MCDALYERSPPRQCCGGKVVASAQVCCGSQSLGIAYDLDSEKTCCGNQYVPDKTTLCCKGPLGELKVNTLQTKCYTFEFTCASLMISPLRQLKRF